MEYTVNKLALLSGISTRALRYYDEIGLLKPARVSSNGYRIYKNEQVDILQQILFYRELGVSLDEIKLLLTASNFDQEKALMSHLSALTQRKEQIEILILNVRKSICSMKGETIMSNKEKFEGFKQRIVDENENKYGSEIRQKYGEDAINAFNENLMGLTQEQLDFESEVNCAIKLAFASGDASGELAMKACEKHKQWLCMFWDKGVYSKETHKGIGEMYVADERFKAYYDKIAVGSAEFLRDAINIYCK